MVMPKKPKNKKMIKRLVLLSPVIDKKIKQLSKESGRSKSYVIRAIITRSVKSLSEKK